MTEQNNGGGNGGGGNYGGYGMGSGGYGSGGYGGGAPAGGGGAPRTGFGGREMETVTDPNENAFQIQMPKGWRNQAVLARLAHDTYRTIASAQSQDGATTLFFGDPHLPSFVEPTPDFNPQTLTLPFLPPHMRFQSFIPAEPFFLHDLQQRYRQAPGFRITGAAPNPRLDQVWRAEAQRQGLNVQVTTTLISFEYQGPNGAPVRGLLNGATYRLGPMWNAEVSGVTTASGDPAPWNDLLFEIAQSKQMNPQWVQQQQYAQNQYAENSRIQHQNTMNSIYQNGQISAQNHQMRMNDIQRSGDAHQGRMNALHQTNDAQMRAWQAQQAQNDGIHRSFNNAINGPSGGFNNPNAAGYQDGFNSQDASHARFVNYINDEETVVDQSGQTYQVETGHDRYFVNTTDNTYVATDSTVERADLGSQMGLNPDNYEETRIRE